MNVLFLSPFFPPNADRFCRALHARGVNVLAIGDEPPERQPADLVLGEYVYEPAMAHYPALRAATAGLIARHGRLDRIESNNEHWLQAEGKLRDDFAVSGLSESQTRALRSKSMMASVFAKAAIIYPPTMRGTASASAQAREEAARLGLPLVIKPDSGSGAVDTFVVSTESELDAALRRDLSGHVLQPFVSGDIVTFDGLADANGQIVFFTSHRYDRGIMQVREGRIDGHYYSLRDIPADLERVGRRAVAAFDIRERFFHAELFMLSDASYVGLEMNIRPPGGYTTDMMNAACGIDVYDLWAGVLSGESFADFSYTRGYHAAHAGRRFAHRYLLTDAELQRELGDTLFAVRSVPDVFAATMGNVGYLLRHPNLVQLKQAISRVQQIRD